MAWENLCHKKGCPSGVYTLGNYLYYLLSRSVSRARAWMGAWVRTSTRALGVRARAGAGTRAGAAARVWAAAGTRAGAGAAARPGSWTRVAAISKNEANQIRPYVQEFEYSIHIFIALSLSSIFLSSLHFVEKQALELELCQLWKNPIVIGV